MDNHDLREFLSGPGAIILALLIVVGGTALFTFAMMNKPMAESASATAP